VRVVCPKCGHEQEEAPTAYSSACKSCRAYFRVQDVLHPSAAPQIPDTQTRVISCFDCGTALSVSPTAQSTMCKRCSSHVDLADYRITQSVSRNFRTKGTMVVEESGYLFNSETTATHIVIKGRFIGQLHGEQTLEIHPKAQIKGNFHAAQLILPSETRWVWPEPIVVDAADISGELVGTLHCKNAVRLRATARMFGDVEAGHLVMEAGAVFVGRARVGSGRPKSSPPSKAPPAAG
jgi:cytoskeletal protein CcmA (bactofilin family)